MQEKKNDSNSLQYACSCGKVYKSKPAVYTHIKNKHNSDKYNFRIIDSLNVEVDNNRAIRLSQIKWNETQSSLMTLADLTYIEIAKIISEEKLVESEYLLDIDFISDSEDQNAGSLPKRILQKKIKESGLEEKIRNAQERYSDVLQPFKLQKFQLGIQHQLAKHFQMSFYSKISMQILLYFCKRSQLDARIESYQNTLWKPSQKRIKEEIQKYCGQWVFIKNKES